MKNYDEIKDIIVKQLGIKDMDAYKAYLEAIKTRTVTQKEVELLSPDNIDNKAFWRIALEMFGIDCVSNTLHGPVRDVVEANRRNLSLARTLGICNMIDEWRSYSCNVLEIGAGFGSLRNYIEATTSMAYTGVDVHPKIEGIIELSPDGFLTDEVKIKQYPLIVSTNVFQHLSVKQRRRYYRDIAQIIHPRGGIFVFNMLVNLRPDIKQSYFDGKNYLRHYGQFTEIQDMQTIMDDLYEYFHVHYVGHRRLDDLMSFTCTLKPPQETKPLTETENPVILST